MVFDTGQTNSSGGEEKIGKGRKKTRGSESCHTIN